MISYLKLTDKKLVLLINFNVAVMKNGPKRFVNNFEEVVPDVGEELPSIPQLNLRRGLKMHFSAPRPRLVA
jgi:hypothetical protein